MRAFDSSGIEGKATPRIDDFGVTVEEYLAGLAEGIDILEVKSLEDGDSNRFGLGID